MEKELTPIIDLEAYRKEHPREERDFTPSYKHLLVNMPPGSKEIDLLRLSTRTRNLLGRSGFTGIHQLASTPDEALLDIDRFGRRSLAELRQRLNGFNPEHPA